MGFGVWDSITQDVADDLGGAQEGVVFDAFGDADDGDAGHVSGGGRGNMRGQAGEGGADKLGRHGHEDQLAASPLGEGGGIIAGGHEIVWQFVARQVAGVLPAGEDGFKVGWQTYPHGDLVSLVGEDQRTDGRHSSVADGSNTHAHRPSIWKRGLKQGVVYNRVGWGGTRSPPPVVSQ